MSNSVISVENVSKAYPLYKKPLDILKESFFKQVEYDLFWALRGISFEVLEKQRVGIIGQNGAGKSTLLQLICGNLTPTSGKISVKGKISALMSLVPSWNLEETGLENIKFNLLLQGYFSKKIPTLVEEIIEFSELGGFIYRPVKTYSSGMSARLSFAIATAIIPEILIIDEVLGVGDGYFANKAVKRVKELCDRGKALLFVSHSLAAVRSMCNKVIWMENGSIRLIGDSDFVISQYEEDIIKSEERTVRTGNMSRLEQYKQCLAAEDVMENENLCQFRIREAHREKMLGTHFVRNIKFLTSGSNKCEEISLFHNDIRHQNVTAVLELNSSEWGRLYTKNGSDCRILVSCAGHKQGGHFSIKRPSEFLEVNWPVVISMEINSENINDALVVESLNLEAASWVAMDLVKRENLQKGWFLVVFKGIVSVGIKGEERKTLVDQLKAIRQAPVEIVNINVLSNQKTVYSVKEFEPFILQVHIRSNQKFDSISVNINVLRADGVFTFYQPSGLEKNIENFSGDALVNFDFSNNPFGAGEYEVNVFVCNGWSWDNIPPSDILDRSIGAFRFSVVLLHSIPFGLINIRVPVSISLLDAIETEGEKCV